MNSIIIFFTKYKLQINIILLFFWLFIIYDDLTSPDFKLIQLVLPIVFILICFFTIFQTLSKRKN